MGEAHAPVDEEHIPAQVSLHHQAVQTRLPGSSSSGDGSGIVPLVQIHPGSRGKQPWDTYGLIVSMHDHDRPDTALSLDPSIIWLMGCRALAGFALC